MKAVPLGNLSVPTALMASAIVGGVIALTVGRTGLPEDGLKAREKTLFL